MVIDFHTHIFPDRIADAALERLRGNCHTQTFTDGTMNGLKSSMERAGIQCAVVLPVATSPRQVSHINLSSKLINDRAGETGVLSFGAMHPALENWEEEMENVRAMGMKGIKLHPVYQDADMDDARNVRLLKKAGQLGLMVIVHAGLDVGVAGKKSAMPDKIRRARDQAPDVTLILAHMGGWRSWEEAERLLKDTGVYVDTSFSLGDMTPLNDGYYKFREELKRLDESGFVQLIHAFGADHTLFGTDSPWSDQKEAVAEIARLSLDETEKQMIYSGTAKKLLGIP